MDILPDNLTGEWIIDDTVDNKDVSTGFMQSGTVTVSPVAATNLYDNSVTFVPTFGVTPIVVATPENTVTTDSPAEIHLTISSVSTTGFHTILENTAALNGDVIIRWIAMVPKTG